MTVRRIVANIAASNPALAKPFYGDILGMDIAMDFGWITTFAAFASAAPQISIASEGGSGTDVPDVSIEVDNFEVVLADVRAAGLALEYGPVTETWGVQRFYVRDPFGRLVNILSHVSTSG